ncbi:pectinesterase family protein [Streptomyces desertarenae]|uniref:Pectinesterase n=1 Tax=Streptomyces desertarenae TaxID=2666184 RepID=A0ABW4PR39_9ACTN
MSTTRRGALLAGAGAALSLALAGRAHAGAPDRPTGPVLRVAPDGSGDFTTVQAAVDAVPDRPGTPWTIALAPGVYRETVQIPEAKTGLTLLGGTGDPRDTVIVYDNAAGTPKPDGSGTYGTSGSATVTARPDGFTARRITFANDWLRADHPEITGGTQAVAVKVTGDRSLFDRCRFLGHQDTLYADTRHVSLTARQFFHRCHVEGDVDFVFGRATAVLHGCELRTLDRDVDFRPYGFVFAPSTAAGTGHGFLAHRCRFTTTAPAGAYKLARPWVPSSDPTARPRLVVRDSLLGAGIDAAEPYANMREHHPWQGFFFREYANRGPGAAVTDPAARPQLTAAEAAGHTPAVYLGGWRPAVR